jgi:hypothetical protein
MMGDMGVGGTLETRISGNDLIILLEQVTERDLTEYNNGSKVSNDSL